MIDTPASGVLVDSNVLLDLFTDDPAWAVWSASRALLTRDASRYRTLLPALTLISP